MIRLFSLLLLFLSISFAVPKHVKETLKELSPGIYGVFGVYEQVSPKNRGFISNAYFIITRDGVIVFDALSTYKLGKELVETIRGCSKNPSSGLSPQPLKGLTYSSPYPTPLPPTRTSEEKGPLARPFQE